RRRLVDAGPVPLRRQHAGQRRVDADREAGGGELPGSGLLLAAVKTKRKSLARVGVYAGSFDPPTIGHLWMIEKASTLFDELVVAVGVNPDKRTAFSVDQRLNMLRSCTTRLRNVRVDTFIN